VKASRVVEGDRSVRRSSVIRWRVGDRVGEREGVRVCFRGTKRGTLERSMGLCVSIRMLWQIRALLNRGERTLDAKEKGSRV
jgi:hypothetical protein